MKKVYLTLIISFPCLLACAQLPQLNLVKIASGFTHPVDIRNCGDNRIFVVDQDGRIAVMDKQGNMLNANFLDIHAKVDTANEEQGLLGLVFSPNYKQDGLFYVNYIAWDDSGATGPTHISRFKVSAADSNQADTTEQVLLTIEQPFDNHKGGFLAFGKDGYLYDSQGDGGSEGDPLGNGQNTAVLLSKILRLDVSNPDTTYVVPPTNPFVGQPAIRPEIWAYGLRNPWRCSFDVLTGDLWIADVGQNSWEEVDFQPASSAGGQNYGWRCYEGDHIYDTTGCVSASDMTFPIFEYAHTDGNCAIIGGYVSRGAQYSNLFGKYIYVDYCSGIFVDIRQPSPGVFVADTLQQFLANQDVWSCFGLDNENELYVAGVANGNVYHVIDTSTCVPVAFISLKDTIANCSSVTLTALYGDSLSYQWYNSGGMINGATSNQFMTNSDGWFSVMVSKTGSPGCSAMSDSVYANVQQDALIPCSNCPQTFCTNQAPVSLNPYFSPSGGVYYGNGLTNDSTFSPAEAMASTDTLQYSYTNPLGCVTSASLILKVNDTVGLIPSIPDTFYLNNGCTAPFPLSGFVIPSGGVYQGNGITNDSIFNPINVSAGVDTITYLYTSSGCYSHAVVPLNIQNGAVDCEGISGPSINEEVKVFPNPNDGSFLLSYDQNYRQMDISIWDIQGILVYKESINDVQAGKKEFNLASLAKGIYMMKVTTESGLAVQRLVIQ